MCFYEYEVNLVVACVLKRKGLVSTRLATKLTLLKKGPADSRHGNNKKDPGGLHGFIPSFFLQKLAPPSLCDTKNERVKAQKKHSPLSEHEDRYGGVSSCIPLQRDSADHLSKTQWW